VRIWNLLLGTSGIPNTHDLLRGHGSEPIGNGTVLAAVSNVPRLDFRPGTGGDDTDGDYVLLALVVETVTHRSLAAFLATDVFPAAGLHSAVLDRDPTGPDVAASYQHATDAEPYRDESWRTVGDIGLHATAKDLATWGAQYWHPTVGGAVVARERMRTVRGDDNGIIPGAKPVSSAFSWGTGIGVWTVEGGRLVAGSAGPDEAWFSEDAFQSDLVVIPSQHLAAAALCNHLQPDPHVASELAMRLLGVMRGRPLPHPVPYP
jgi:CubicO group peptidase (beta-lactamase class C family)